MKKVLTCAALSVVLLSGCSFLHKNDGILSVNNQIVTRQEFNEALDKEINNSFFKNFGGAENFLKTDANPMYAIFRDKVINELVVRALIDEEIEKRGIKATEEDIQNEIKTIIDKVGSKEELNSMLKKRGISNKEFTKDLESQIKIRKLVETIEKINVTDSEVEKYYKTNIQEFKHGEQVRASHILISADTIRIIKTLKQKNKDLTPQELDKKVEETIATQKAKAEAILKEVKANPDKFEKIAKKESEDFASGERGGELGYFTREAMVKEFSDAAFSMKPNTISENVVKSPFGFHIIKVTDKVEAGTRPLIKVKDEIKFYLETKKQIKVLKNLTDGKMKTAKIEYLDESFKPNNDIAKNIKEADKK